MTSAATWISWGVKIILAVASRCNSGLLVLQIRNVHLNNRVESNWVIAGLFAIAASTLIVEIALTKFLAYKVFYHYSYAVISMVIFSFGAAGAVLYAFRSTRMSMPSLWIVRAISVTA